MRIQSSDDFCAYLAHAVEQLGNWLIQLKNNALLPDSLDNLGLVGNMFFAGRRDWLKVGILFNTVSRKWNLPWQRRIGRNAHSWRCSQSSAGLAASSPCWRGSTVLLETFVSGLAHRCSGSWPRCLTCCSTSGSLIEPFLRKQLPTLSIHPMNEDRCSEHLELDLEILLLSGFWFLAHSCSYCLLAPQLIECFCWPNYLKIVWELPKN